MSHNHHHHSDKNIKTAFFLNLVFTIIEIIGGIMTNSVAIIADAVHDLGDSVSLGLSWYLQHISKKGETAVYTYGYKRFSVLGALITSIILIIGSAIILTKTIPRFINPEQTDAKGMLLLAVLGVIVNGYAVFKTRKGTSLNERVVSLHLLEDVLGWVAVLVGATLMYFYDLPWIDPLLSLLIAIYVLKNVYTNLREVIRIIMQGVPEGFNSEKIKGILKSHPSVRAFKELHIWSLDGEHHVMSVSLKVNRDISIEEMTQVRLDLKTKLIDLDISYSTIEFE